MNRSILAMAVTSLLPSSYLMAQELSVDETVVVFARSENVNTVVDIPSNVVVISREEIEKSGVKSLESLLRARAGIQISDSNSGAGFSIRGFSGEQAASNTLVMLDGRRLNSQDLVAPNLSFIQLDDIESIEILSGSAGVLYGDQAVGGVINIVTRSSKEKRVNVSTSYGSYNSSVQNISASGPIDDQFSYRFSATQNNSDNYRDHNASENGSLLGRVDYQDESKKLFVEFGYYDVAREYAGSLTEEQFEEDPSQANSTYPDDNNHAITRTVRLGYDQQLAPNWRLKNELLFDDTQENGISWATDKEAQGGHLFYSGQVEAGFDTDKGAANLILGVDLARNHYEYLGAWTDRENDQGSWNVYTRYSHPLIEDLVVNVGARYAKVVDDIKDAAQFPQGEKLREDASAYELSLNYAVTDQSRIYLRTESNFRFAKVSEQSYTLPGVKGLKPQTGLSNELGWNLYQPTYSLGINLYQLKLEDEIVYASDPGTGNAANMNADASTRTGGSLTGELYLWDDWQLTAEYNYVDAEFTEGENKGNQVAWVAKNTGKLGVNYDITANFDLYADAIYTGKRYEDGDYANSKDMLDDYWLVNLAVNYRYADLNLSLRADNLLNQQYASYVYYGGYYSGNERAYYFTASYQF